MFEKLLIANRGEIAVRIARTAREMGIQPVSVYSEADRDALHVRMADEAYCVGPPAPSQSYLNVEALLDAARRSGAQAIHPGYGFLAENAAFARSVVAAGFVWIGPHADAIDAMGDKIRAREAMIAVKVPVVPGGTDVIANVEGARDAARRYGLPLALKAAGGGGGKGLKVAQTLAEVESAFTTAQREALAYFKNGTIYAERYLENPKHIELQLLADKHGAVVHLGERDCSLQRRHQKVWEEASAVIPPRVREAIRDAGLRAARAIGYDSVGTMECLVAGDEFYFLEMNTRIQVEHTVTEMIAGIDLVREQIRVSAGEPLGYDQSSIVFRGHAIEGRINAEDPSRNFRPSPGTLSRYREPGGLGVRVDSAAFPGLEISAEYDSLIAKLVVWAPDRDQAVARMRRALDEYIIDGVATTLPLLRELCDRPEVRDSSYGTATLERFVAERSDGLTPAGALPSPRAAAAPADAIRIEVNGKLFHVRLFDTANAATRRAPRVKRTNNSAATFGNDVLSPMHGAVVEILLTPGAAVAQGEVVAVIEAMKMMNEVRAHKAGKASKVHVRAGDTVEARSPIVTIE